LKNEDRADVVRAEMTEEGVQQMLHLAERLRESNGGELDESAILAVAEATGAPVEYVRLAVRLRPEEKKRGFIHRMRSEYLGLDPEVKRNVVGVSLGVVFGLASVLSAVLISSFAGLLGVVQILCACVIVVLAALAKDARAAAIMGALVTGVGFLAATIFHAAFNVAGSIDAALIFPIALGGTIGAMVANLIVSKNRKRLGMKDPVQERQDLLRQLVDLQTRLKSGEQKVTFLSVDVVGSTQMKAQADALSIEYTFNEYHQYVDRIVRKYGGNVHSTAGDGLICAFDTPSQAFGSAKNMQSGLIELNTFGNKTSTPIALRVGIHTGDVVAPTPGDIGSVNFAHVIDIAAHLQKAAPVGGIAVSQETASALPGGPNVVGPETVEAQGTTAFVWRPKTAQEVPIPTTPPPFDLGS
jgi:class 3 adenylate cyclase